MNKVTPLSFFEEDITEEINHGIRVSNLAYYTAKSLGLYETQCHELAAVSYTHLDVYKRQERFRRPQSWWSLWEAKW